MKVIKSGLTGLAAMGLVAAPAMAQNTADLDVTVTVQNYAALTVTESEIILNLVDDASGTAEFDDAGGQYGILELQSNYATQLVVTSGSGLMESDAAAGNWFVQTENSEGDLLGVWPQLTDASDVSGQSLFGWDGVSEAVMDGLHRENSGGTGIPAGAHQIAVTVSSQLNRTPDGTWAEEGTYNGDLVVTVIDF